MRSSRNGVALLAGLLAAAALSAAARAPERTDEVAEPTADAIEPTVEVVASGLEVPWSLAFARDGRLFIAERPGRIRVVVDGRLEEGPWAELDVASFRGLESGLMGIAIDPDFPSEPFVYACHGFGTPDHITNRIVRLREIDGRGRVDRVLLDSIPGGQFHDGCRLGFGPDGMLYSTHGEATQEDLAQRLDSPAGKILRMRRDGSRPDDNPFEGSLVWSLGHRNPQGLAWDPATGDLWSTEHGTSGYNEINRIERGGNYGWPFVRAGEEDDRFIEPAAGFIDIPPAGAAFVVGNRYAGLEGALVFASLGTGSLQSVRVDAADVAGSRRELIDDRFGRLRDVVLGPDGYLYVATSNRDQLGDPGPDDDRILRILAF